MHPWYMGSSLKIRGRSQVPETYYGTLLKKDRKRDSNIENYPYDAHKNIILKHYLKDHGTY